MPYRPGPLTIPDLPKDLRDVPALPTGPDDPNMEAIRADWRRWRDGVIHYRRRIWRLCGERRDGATGQPLPEDAPEIDPDEAEQYRALELARCMADSVYFKAVWCAVHETRGGFGRAKGWQPAVPYPFQVAYHRWRDFLLDLAEAQDERVTAADSKARTMGITWDLCLWDLHGFLFREAFVAKLVSETAAKVDSGSLDSLFSRITSQFDWKRGRTVGNPLHLPTWMWPAGFDRERDKVDMLLANPENGNEINGEGTKSTTGRAGRATVGDVDEAAAITGLKHTLGALTETLGLTILTSSESVKEDTFFVEYVEELRQRDSPLLFEVDWWMHPLYTQAWLEATRETYAQRGDLAAFEREILRQGRAGLSAYCYPKARGIQPGDFPYVPGSPVWVGFDPGMDDETALVVLCRDLVTGRYRLVTAYSNRSQEPEFYASLISGIEDERFAYGPAEHAFMAEMAAMPLPEALYGDPYGSNKVAGGGWYVKMMAWWDEQEKRLAAEGTPRRLQVPVVLNWKRTGPGAGRNLQERRIACNALLDRLDFHDDPQGQVRETIRALQSVKWDVDDRAAEQRSPKHNHQHTHRTSALEYFAVNKDSLPLDLGPASNDPYEAVTA